MGQSKPVGEDVKFIGNVPTVDVGGSGDRGCVSCGVIAKMDLIYTVDMRDRYWCLDCANDALSNVRRRVDKRIEPEGTYPWRFDVCPSCASDKITREKHDEHFEYGTGGDTATLTAHAVTFGVCDVCKFSWTDHDAELKRTDAICRHLQKTLATTRDVLGALRDEFELMSRGVPGERDIQALSDAASLLIGPSKLSALPPARHITWADNALCRFVPYSQKHWPPSQTAVPVHELLPRPGPKGSFTETFASLLTPTTDLSGVTCAACKTALPEFLKSFDRMVNDLTYSDVSYGDGKKP